MHAADRCRQEGWKVGDRLIGMERGHVDTIEITAIGMEKILARVIECNRGFVHCGESLWDLEGRFWRRTEQPTASA